MVVLEAVTSSHHTVPTSTSMFGSGSNHNQYLQPDYLSPLPTTLDAKKSPLALLAQTCSQIGADSSNSKSIIPPIEKSSKSDVDKRSNRSPSTPDVGGKSKMERREESSSSTEEKPSSRSSAAVTPVTSTSVDIRQSTSAKLETSSSPTATSSSSVAPTSSASPIVRSGLEVLQGHPKDMPLGTYRPGMFPPLGLPPPLCGNVCLPGQERDLLRFTPGFPVGYPMTSTFNPYLSYARLKAGEGLSPSAVCRDPYCNGCGLGSHHNSLLMGSCPSGCRQCDHPKIPVSTAAAFSSMPYVCNWIVGDSYCGKRFPSSDELFAHLRTHTTGLNGDLSALSLLGYPMVHPGLSSLHRAYSSIPPLSDLRYHPYGKPATVPSLTPPTTAPLPPLPPLPPGVSPYYNPYALFGSRLGAAVHP